MNKFIQYIQHKKEQAIRTFFSRNGVGWRTLTVLMLFFTAFLLHFAECKFCINNQKLLIILDSKDSEIVIPVGTYLIYLTVLVIILLLLRKRYRDTGRNFASPFIKKGRELFIWINATIGVVIIISALVHFSNCDKDGNILSFFNLTSFLLGIFSIFVTCRVYFEVKKEKTNTLDEYLDRLTHIIANSGNDDEILMIAPTVILGQAHENNSYVIDGYLDEIFQFLENGKLTIALLDFDIKNVGCLFVNKETAGRGSTGNLKYKTSRLPTAKVPDKQSVRKPLFAYHCANASLFFKDQEEAGDYMNLHLLSNLKKLESKKCKFIKLKSEMFIIGDDYSKSSGFFAIANFTKGLYYMGNFSVSRKIHRFQGTYFENEHIGYQMRHTLKGSIEGFCIEDDKHKLNEI